MDAETSGEVLKQRFILLAQSAAEASNEEAVIAATMMADLLTVAAMFREDSATNQRAEEILEFCQQQALPLLTDPGSEDRQKILVQQAKSRWSEYLTLLSPEERLTFRQPSGWIDADNEGWNEALQSEGSDGSWAADDLQDANSENRQQAPFDMAGILAWRLMPTMLNSALPKWRRLCWHWNRVRNPAEP